MPEKLNVHNSGFRKDVTLEITGEEYAISAGAIEQLFNANIQLVRPLKYRYYDENDELVFSPSEQDLQSGKIKKEFDPLGFMSANNLVEAYVGESSFVIMKALENRFAIHDRGIEAGKAESIEVLIAEMNKSKLEIVDED